MRGSVVALTEFSGCPELLISETTTPGAKPGVVVKTGCPILRPILRWNPHGEACAGSAQRLTRVSGYLRVVPIHPRVNNIITSTVIIPATTAIPRDSPVDLSENAIGNNEIAAQRAGMSSPSSDEYTRGEPKLPTFAHFIAQAISNLAFSEIEGIAKATSTAGPDHFSRQAILSIQSLISDFEPAKGVYLFRYG